MKVRRGSRWPTLLIQMALILLIIALLFAIWMPVLVGPHPSANQ